ncbi:hypothetical protein [Thermosyntropha sp.]|uniref:hypothetical protein n=1 Tax=Thermosyntropha sp. TaxID=2740820 RepID=UPI0025DF19C2|nr:hypothetical protein [Thermosyntropha sp.]MBO8159734.1 hypothetical protein [Thermosyntropha sp.]
MRNNKPKAGLAFYLGIIVFFYFGFDLIINRYPWQETLLKGVIALSGLFLPGIIKMKRDK